MVAVKSKSGRDLFWNDLKFPDRLKMSIFPKSMLLSIFLFRRYQKYNYFSEHFDDVKKNINLMFLSRRYYSE